MPISRSLLLNRREGTTGRWVEANLHELQPIVVIVPKIGEQLRDVEDPHLGKLQIPLVADADLTVMPARVACRGSDTRRGSCRRRDSSLREKG